MEKIWCFANQKLPSIDKHVLKCSALRIYERRQVSTNFVQSDYYNVLAYVNFLPWESVLLKLMVFFQQNKYWIVSSPVWTLMVDDLFAFCAHILFEICLPFGFVMIQTNDKNAKKANVFNGNVCRYVRVLLVFSQRIK